MKFNNQIRFAFTYQGKFHLFETTEVDFLAYLSQDSPWLRLKLLAYKICRTFLGSSHVAIVDFIYRYLKNIYTKLTSENQCSNH